jgi:hypothetical protein
VPWAQAVKKSVENAFIFLYACFLYCIRCNVARAKREMKNTCAMWRTQSRSNGVTSCSPTQNSLEIVPQSPNHCAQSCLSCPKILLLVRLLGWRPGWDAWVAKRHGKGSKMMKEAAAQGHIWGGMECSNGHVVPTARRATSCLAARLSIHHVVYSDCRWLRKNVKNTRCAQGTHPPVPRVQLKFGA